MLVHAPKAVGAVGVDGSEAVVVGDATAAGPALVVRDLTVTYISRGSANTAVHHVDLTIRAGERVALIGESGSGKTATCLAVAGHLPPGTTDVVATEMRLDGVDLTLRNRRRSQIPTATPGLAMVFQDAMSSLDPVWTVGSQLGAVIRARTRMSRRHGADEARTWLQRVGLRDVDRVLCSRPYELSGGMRQRVMIAAALASRPKLLIADEPTSALDATLSRSILELLLQLTDEFGVALLLVSHDIHLAQQYCDRTVVMYGGRIVEEGSSQQVRDEPHHPYTRGLLASVPTLASAALSELPSIREHPSGLAADWTGCGFAARCDRASELCAERPARVELARGHAVWCWNPDASPPRVAGNGANEDGER